MHIYAYIRVMEGKVQHLQDQGRRGVYIHAYIHTYICIMEGKIEHLQDQVEF